MADNSLGRAASVTSSLIGRAAETEAVDELLNSVAVNTSSSLVIDGEPGVGKTTLWRDAIARARGLGMRVLTARTSAAESVLAYATLADLLADVDHAQWADLPSPQRYALAAALLEDVDGGPLAADPRAVGAAFLAVLRRLTAESHVLLAIDDAQWLDASSTAALAFALRRLPGRLAVVATVRTDAAPTATSWLDADGTNVVRRIRLSPLAIAEIHQLLTTQLGHPVSRPRLLRVFEMSGGNPFYAVELARELDRHGEGGQLALPDSLAELMSGRIGQLRGDVSGALLAVAILGDPTISRVAEALELTSTELVELLSDAEEQGVVTITGQRLAFTHPLLAHAVQARATPAQRRWTHRRLADVVTEPELRARHLALADPTGEPETLAALDAAADIARARNAPAAAADMLELAVRRGGATHRRRILLAQCLFDSGDVRESRNVLEAAIDDSSTGSERAEARQRLAMVRLHDDGFADATVLIERAMADDGDDAELQVGLQIMLAFTQLNSGRPDIARTTAETALRAAVQLRDPELITRARGIRAMTRFFIGEELDAADLRPDPTLERFAGHVPMPLRPDVQSALLRGWTADYASAREELDRIAVHCATRGEEGELMFLAFNGALLDIWRGELAAAAEAADRAVDRALELGTGAASFLASALQAAVAAHQGNVEDARRHCDRALAAGAESGYVLMMGYVIGLQGFIELSLGNHEDALAFLKPLLPVALLSPRCSEINVAGFLPDAVEALVNRGRYEEAEPLVAALEVDGARLNRQWMLAVGARCRAVLTAAGGDPETAAAHARRALQHHDQLDMPFERARTLLVLGRIERRLRRWRPAAATLSEALALFERVGTPLWAAQARTELERGTPGRAKASGLTPAERRIAELATEGMSTRDIAATLYVAPKTVETTLARAYAKLGVHSRIELAQAMRNAASAARGDGGATG